MSSFSRVLVFLWLHIEYRERAHSNKLSEMWILLNYKKFHKDTVTKYDQVNKSVLLLIFNVLV